jgi:hypothetical protein
MKLDHYDLAHDFEYDVRLQRLHGGLPKYGDQKPNKLHVLLARAPPIHAAVEPFDGAWQPHQNGKLLLYDDYVP